MKRIEGTMMAMRKILRTNKKKPSRKENLLTIVILKAVNCTVIVTPSG